MASVAHRGGRFRTRAARSMVIFTTSRNAYCLFVASTGSTSRAPGRRPSPRPPPLRKSRDAAHGGRPR
eukprot:13528114-Heterocapsa_arctica.AAC.1